MHYQNRQVIYIVRVIPPGMHQWIIRKPPLATIPHGPHRCGQLQIPTGPIGWWISSYNNHGPTGADQLQYPRAPSVQIKLQYPRGPHPVRISYKYPRAPFGAESSYNTHGAHRWRNSATITTGPHRCGSATITHGPHRLVDQPQYPWGPSVWISHNTHGPIGAGFSGQYPRGPTGVDSAHNTHGPHRCGSATIPMGPPRVDQLQYLPAGPHRYVNRLIVY